MTAHPRPQRHQRHAASRSRTRRDQPIDGDCALRDRGSDARCSGTERISIADGCGTYRRGCTEHAAQALLRFSLAHISSSSTSAVTALEERMRQAGTWHPRMRPTPLGRH